MSMPLDSYRSRIPEISPFAFGFAASGDKVARRLGFGLSQIDRDLLSYTAKHAY